MPKTQTKNPHPIIKILSDLNLLPEKGEDVDAKSYKRAVRTAIVTIESSSKDQPAAHHLVEMQKLLSQEQYFFALDKAQASDQEPHPKSLFVGDQPTTSSD